MQWYLKKYGVDVGKKKKGAQKDEKQEPNTYTARVVFFVQR